MRSAMKRILPSLLVLALVFTLAAPTAADAYLLRVDFSVLADWGDPVYRGHTASGYFTFDSALIPPSPYPGGRGMNWRTLGWRVPDLSFTWDGHLWSTSNADLFAVYSDPSGALGGWQIGGKPSGLNALSGNVFPDFYAGSRDFWYTTAYGQGTIYFGTTTSWRGSPVRVPEPSTLLLLGPGLLVLSTIRRRKV